MNAKQTRRLLIAAFAISLLVHALIALKIRWPFAPPKDEVQIVRIERMRTLRIVKLPTPPPSTPPPATPAPTPSAAATARAKGVKLPSLLPGNGPAAGSPKAAPTPVATTPKPSATPDCAQTDTPATLVTKPEQPDISADARAAATNGTAKVLVHLDGNGVVTQASVVQSSGNPSLDLVALGVARGAHYAPGTHACKPVASEYTFVAKFVAQ